MKTKMKIIFLYVIGMFLLSTSFATCVDDESKILYRDGYVDTYRYFNNKVTDYFDKIVDDNTYYETDGTLFGGRYVEPDITINECTSKKFFKVEFISDDVEEKTEGRGRNVTTYYSVYQTTNISGTDVRTEIYSGDMFDYTGELYTFSGEKYMYFKDENYDGGDWVYISGDAYNYTGESENFVTCENTTYNLNDFYYNRDTEVVTPDYTYKDGRDYVWSNMCEIQKTYNEDYDCTTLYDDVDINVVSYNKGEHSFEIREVSYGENTTNFATRNIDMDYEDYLSFFRGQLNSGGDRMSINSDKTELSDSTVIAGDSLNITGAINLQLPYTGCDDVRYEYGIYYVKDEETDADGNYVFRLITADKFAITKDGVLYGIDVDGNLVNKDDVFYIEDQNRYFVDMTWDDYWKKAVVTINESVFLTKKGDYKFALLVKDEFGNSKAIWLNTLPVDVVPNIPSETTSTVSLVGYDPSLSYYPNDTLDIVVSLKDKFGNTLYDIDQGITISYETVGSSIEFLGDSWLKDKISGLKSLGDITKDPIFSTKFRFTEPGLYPLTYNIKYYNKNKDGDYDGTTTDIKLSVTDGGAVKKLYIEDPASATSDFSISCTNNKIVLGYTCRLDNFSGCNPYRNSSITFTSESDNGKDGFLSISDYAGNYKQMYYSINHIDKTAPTIKVGLENSADYVTSSSKTILATDEALHINLTDYRPAGCSANRNIVVRINGVVKYSNTTSAPDLYIARGEFEKKGDYNIDITVTDAAGNTASLSKIIKVIPNNKYNYKYDGFISNYADGNHEITFKFKIYDEFDNLVERNDILDGVTLYSNLDNKEISSSFEDSLNIIDYTLNSGVLSIKTVLYNKDKDNIKLTGKIKLYSVSPKDISPYYDKESSIYAINIDSSANISSVGNIFNTGVLSGSDLTINEVGDLFVEIPVDNCGVNDIIKNVKVKMDLTFVDSFTSTRIDGMKIEGDTGYVDMVEDLQNGGYTIPGVYSCGDKIRVDFKGRFVATNGVPSPKLKLSSVFSLYYTLSGLKGDKNIEKTVQGNSELEINYWGVVVKGLFTNSSKGLYELLRKGDISMNKSSSTLGNQIDVFNKIKYRLINSFKGHDYKSSSDISGVIKGVNKFNSDIHLGDSTIDGKSVILVEGHNIYIDGNIRKNNNNSILTIAAFKNEIGVGGKIIIDPSVTNIDAIIITEGGIYSYDNVADIFNAVKGNKNTELNNQLAIYGMIISKKNTIGGSIAMNNSYVLPGGKKLSLSPSNYFRSAFYDLNFLRRYHFNKNKGTTADDPINGGLLKDSDYGTNPVVIIYDSAIKALKPYGF